MTVWVDAQEKPEVASLVAAECSEASTASGFGADYAVGGYLIERKRWQEVAGRMTETDGHLFHQVEKLEAAAAEMALEPALLLEGELGSAIRHSSVTAEQVALYLAGLPVLGVTVIPSTGRACTARVLARLEDGEPPDPERARGAVPDGVDPQRFVVEGVPGVGPSTARALLDELGDPRAVAVASREELMEAEGVGPATADAVREAFGG
jgi:Fanconi anemia group M protein